MEFDWRVAIAERRDRVERELTAVAGGESLCSISRSAGPVPAVKYLEGRVAALQELERAERRGEDLDSFSSEVLGRWSERLGGARQRGMGADWTAYYAGGVDELEDISASEQPAGPADGATPVGAGCTPMMDPCDEGGEAPCWAHLFPEPDIADGDTDRRVGDGGADGAPSRAQHPS